LRGGGGVNAGGQMQKPLWHTCGLKTIFRAGVWGKGGERQSQEMNAKGNYNEKAKPHS